jgi:hypothetical protein
MPRRIVFLLLIAFPLFARADIRWTSTLVSTSAAPSDGRATAEASFTNTGSYPVKITATHTSCGCTAAVADSHSIAPGQTGKIEISFKTLSRHGLYEEPILIDTDDPTARETAIRLRVLVQNPVELLPTLLFWQPGEALTPKVITVSAAPGTVLKNISATCTDSGVDLQVDTIQPGAQYKVTVTPKNAHIKATITVTPAADGKPLRALTAHVRVS